MVEEKKEEEKEDKKDDEKKEEDEPQAMDKVERAEKAVKSYESFEKRLDEKIAKLEDLKADKVLGGEAEAGNVPEKKEETPKEYNDRINKEISEGKHNE